MLLIRDSVPSCMSVRGGRYIDSQFRLRFRLRLRLIVVERGELRVTNRNEIIEHTVNQSHAYRGASVQWE